MCDIFDIGKYYLILNIDVCHVFRLICNYASITLYVILENSKCLFKCNPLVYD